MRKINTFFRKKITIAKWQFNLFGALIVSAALVFGSIGISRAFLSAPWTQTDWSGGVGTSTVDEYKSKTGGISINSGSFTLDSNSVSEDVNGAMDGSSDLNAWTTQTMTDLRNIPNLKSQIEAEARVYSDAGLTQATDGGKVGKWGSLISGQTNLEQPNADAQPTYIASAINGKPAIRFNGEGQYLFDRKADFDIQSGQNQMTQFLVYNSDSSGTPGDDVPIRLGDRSYAFVDRELLLGSTITLDLFNSAIVSETAPTTDVPRIWSQSANSSQPNTYKMYDNGALIYNNNGNAFGAPNSGVNPGYWLGGGNNINGYTNANDFKGDIAESIIFNRELNDFERRQVDKYLSGKYDTNVESTGTPILDSSTKYAGSSSLKAVAVPGKDYFVEKSVDFDSGINTFTALVYTDGLAVTSDDVELLFNGSAVGTSFEDMTGGWYRATASADVSGTGGIGFEIKAGKTVYIDNVDLAVVPTSGNLTSNIFGDGDVMHFGDMTYDATNGDGSYVEVKVRTGNESDLSDARDFTDCEVAPSGQGAIFSTQACFQNNKKYIQYQVKINSPSASFERISFGFVQADSTPPSNSGSNIAIKINPDDDAVLLPSSDGKIWAGNYGYAPNLIWDNGTDGVLGSGIKAYCIYIGMDSNGDPNVDFGMDENRTQKGMLKNSPIDLTTINTNGSNCQFVVEAQDGATTNFNLDSGDYRNYSFGDDQWNGTEWVSNISQYYVNIKAIDNENNISNNENQLVFSYDNDYPGNVRYISLPANFVSNKDVTMNWPDISSADGAKDVPIRESGIAGYQYKIGKDGEWQGDHKVGVEDSFGMDLIPVTQNSYTFNSTYDFNLIVKGANIIYFRSFDRAGYDSTYDSANEVSGVLKYDADSPSQPLNVAVTPSKKNDQATASDPAVSSKFNSYAFSWDAPTLLPGNTPGNTNNETYCYTINTQPSAFTCNYTAKGVKSLSADAFATQPGKNVFYVVARSGTPSINYDNFSSVDFYYDGTAPGMVRGMDISDISIKASSNWKLALSWEVPQDSGAGVDSYKIFRSDKKLNCSLADTDFLQFSEVGSTAGTSYVDAGIAQKTYYYCVKACDSGNSCGASSTTVSKLPTGKFTIPAEIVSQPKINNITTKRANISWTTDRVSDSRVFLGEKSNDYLPEETSNSVQTTDHSIELSNLSPGTKYYYRVKWTDEDGNIGTSEEKSFETAPAPTVKDVKADNVGITSAFIKFTTKGANKAKIYYGESTAFGSAKEISTSTKESDYDFTLGSLNDDTKYYYRINTFDSEGEEYVGTTLDFITLPRPKISNVEVQQIKESAQPGIQVTWQSNTEISSIVSYYPTNNKADKQTEVEVDLLSGQHEITIMNLKPLMTYELIVQGVDKAGNQASSDAYSFTTASDTRPPQISEIVIEGSSTKNQADKLSQLTISWKTDESATAQIEFGEGVGTSYTQRTQEESSLTNDHMVIISGLTPSKVYHLRIISKDQTGNTANSQDTVSITPKAIDSAFELVIGNLMDVFGFLRGIGN